MNDCCTVAIPTIPPRLHRLKTAVFTVMQQTHRVDALSIASDTHKEGAWATRQRALDSVRTEWTFFLDDDDELKPEHCEKLLKHAADTGADYVFSYWDLSCTGDVLNAFGREFDPRNPHHTTSTILVRTELAKSVGFTPPNDTDLAGGEDWRFTLGCVAAGAKIAHLADMTWFWIHHLQDATDKNTSGLPVNW